jgi:uncharacterized membrane protein
MAMAGKDDRSSIIGSPAARNAAIGAGALIATVGAAVIVAKRAKGDKGSDALISDAPKWTLRDRPEGEKGSLIGRSTTINLPRQDVYARWRDFTRFPDFMDNVRSVEKVDNEVSRWTIEAPAGKSVELLTELTHDVSGERIAIDRAS